MLDGTTETDKKKIKTILSYTKKNMARKIDELQIKSGDKIIIDLPVNSNSKKIFKKCQFGKKSLKIPSTL